MLLFFDGFETYGANGTTGANLVNAFTPVYPNKLSEDVDAQITNGYDGGLALQFGSIYDSQWFEWQCTNTNTSTFYLGFHYYLPDAASSDLSGPVVYIKGLTGTILLSLWQYQDGGWTIRLADTGNSQAWGGNIKKHRWYFLEFKIVLSTSATGSVEMRVNGEVVCSVSSIQTASDSIGKLGTIRFNAILSGVKVDNFYVVDEVAGGPVTYLGPSFVEHLHPTADSGVQQWTTSTGSDHYALLDEDYPNASDYVYTSTVNQVDLWDYANTVNIATVHGVQIFTQTNLNTAGNRRLEITCDSNGNVVSANKYLADANTVIVWNVLQKDPDGNIDWTPAAVNAAKFGVKLGA